LPYFEMTWFLQQAGFLLPVKKKKHVYRWKYTKIEKFCSCGRFSTDPLTGKEVSMGGTRWILGFFFFIVSRQARGRKKVELNFSINC